MSDTALWVATFRARESARPDALFHDPLASVLVGDRGPQIARTMPYPKVLAWIMAVRTVAIDRLIFEAISHGVDTVVNIGAGLDTRPYRLALPESLQWIEIDFPHIIRLKETKLVSERPRCRLKRISLDLSDRAVANQIYAEIGAHAKKALIITEGVIVYLDPAQAAQLAQDLRAVPSFRYWIQDYREGLGTWGEPRKLKAQLKKAPFKFNDPNPIGFFARYKWIAEKNIVAMDEGERLGRPFPVPLVGRLFVWLTPVKQFKAFRQSMGYVLFKAAP